MTTGIHAVLADLLGLALWLVIMASLWAELRTKRYILIFPSLLFGALGLVLLVRGGEKVVLLAQLSTLRVEDVRAASFGGRPLADREALAALVDALCRVTWATTEHACQAAGVPVTLTLKSGAHRQVWLASNPCAKGLAVNLSDLGAFGPYHGALYSPASPAALAERGLALPDR